MRITFESSSIDSNSFFYESYFRITTFVCDFIKQDFPLCSVFWLHFIQNMRSWPNSQPTLTKIQGIHINRPKKNRNQFNADSLTSRICGLQMYSENGFHFHSTRLNLFRIIKSPLLITSARTAFSESNWISVNQSH